MSSLDGNFDSEDLPRIDEEMEGGSQAASVGLAELMDDENTQ